MAERCPDSKQVPGRTEARNLADGHRGNVRAPPKGFTLVDIGEMDLNGWNFCGDDGIPQGNAGMRIACRIEDDGVKSASRFLNPGNQLPFHIGLSDVDSHAFLCRQGLDGRIEFLQRKRSIE